MCILRAIPSPGTHLGQERLGSPLADMGPVSPLRYLDTRRNLIWDGKACQSPNRYLQLLPKNPRPIHKRSLA